MRDKPQVSETPVDALIEMEDFAEFLTQTSNKISVSVAYIGEDPFEKRRRKRKQQEREESRREQAVEEREEIAERIQSLNSSFDRPLY